MLDLIVQPFKVQFVLLLNVYVQIDTLKRMGAFEFDGIKDDRLINQPSSVWLKYKTHDGLFGSGCKPLFENN